MTREPLLPRRDFLLSGAAAALPAAPERPNIVVFYADDLDSDEVGCLAGQPRLIPSYTGAKQSAFRAAVPTRTRAC